MISSEQITEIKRLHLAGNSTLQIANTLSISTPSVYKYLKNQEQSISDTHNNDTSYKIQPFIEEISQKINNGVSNNRKIFEELAAKGFEGSYSLLNTYLQQKREEKISKSIRSYQKVETGPGEQGQVDWGQFGTVIVNNMEVKLNAFVYVLSYSRAMYAEFTTSQKQKVWQECHMNAFERLGIPKNLRYDNLKSVVISRDKLPDGEEKVNYNPDFLNFSKYYKFGIEACPVYYPASKGKVESGVKYLRNNFMSGEVFQKTFNSVDELNTKLTEWLKKFANNRVHSTTKQKPSDLWLKESSHLFIPQKDFPRYKYNCIQSRWSSQNCMVTYQKSSYWIPPEFARKKIEVEEVTENGENKLLFFFRGTKIFEHTQSTKPGGWILPPDYKIREKKDKGSRNTRVRQFYEIKIDGREMSYYDNLI